MIAETNFKKFDGQKGIVARNATVNTTVKTRKLFKCTNCKHHCSLLSGTIFESSKLPLTTRFLAIYFITQSKTGLSALHLRRFLGISVNAAFRVKQKIQHVMKSADDTLTLKSLDETITTYDVDGDGLLSQDEMKTMIEDVLDPPPETQQSGQMGLMGPGMAPPPPEEIFTEFDEDGDEYL